MAASRLFGIIGGLGPPSTVSYYQGLLAAHEARGARARMLINHADLKHSLELISRGDREGLAEYLASLINPLAQAGAEFAAIAAVTPHICMAELSQRLSLPIVDMVDALIGRLRSRNVERVAFLGNRFTMGSRLFGRLDAFDLVELPQASQEEVHRIYMNTVAKGRADEADTAFLNELCGDLVGRRQAEAVVVGATELSLALKEEDSAFPLIDCTKAHLDAIALRALDGSGMN